MEGGRAEMRKRGVRLRERVGQEGKRCLRGDYRGDKDSREKEGCWNIDIARFVHVSNLGLVRILDELHCFLKKQFDR